MTDEEKSKEPKNKYAKMTMDEALANLEEQGREIEKLTGLNTDLAAQLEEANKVLESQEKAKLINEILPKSQYKIADLVVKTVEDLKTIKGTLDQAMPPKVNSVRYGVHGADLSNRERGLTVGDRSIVTAAKRKELA